MFLEEQQAVRSLLVSGQEEKLRSLRVDGYLQSLKRFYPSEQTLEKERKKGILEKNEQTRSTLREETRTRLVQIAQQLDTIFAEGINTANLILEADSQHKDALFLPDPFAIDPAYSGKTVVINTVAFEPEIQAITFEGFVRFYNTCIANNLYTMNGVASFKEQAKEIHILQEGRTNQSRGRRESNTARPSGFKSLRRRR